MKIGTPLTPFNVFDIHPREAVALENHFHMLKSKNIKLVIVVIPNNPEAYSQFSFCNIHFIEDLFHSSIISGKVKQITELNIGLLTQCLKMKTLNRLDLSTVGNILLKINTKLNGVNHSFTKDFK